MKEYASKACDTVGTQATFRVLNSEGIGRVFIYGNWAPA